MKNNKNIYLIILIVGTHINFNKVFCQATSGYSTATNPNRPVATSPPDYLGWDATVTIPLEIRHDADKEIQFWTNGGYRARIGNSTEFGLSVGDFFNSTSPDYINNNIDINCTYSAPATEGYRFGGELILSEPNYTNLKYPSGEVHIA